MSFVEEGALPERVVLSFTANDRNVQDEMEVQAFAQRAIAPPSTTELRSRWNEPNEASTEQVRAHTGALIGGFGLLVLSKELPWSDGGVYGGIYWGIGGALLGGLLGWGSVVLVPRLRRPKTPLGSLIKRFSFAFSPERFEVLSDGNHVRTWKLSDLRAFRADRLRLYVDTLDGSTHDLQIGLDDREVLAQLAARACALLAAARVQSHHYR